MLDNSNELGYNDTRYDVNESVTDTEAQVIKMDEARPINDVECKHETLIPNPDDTIGDAVYHGCANPKCGVGFYIVRK